MLTHFFNRSFLEHVINVIFMSDYFRAYYVIHIVYIVFNIRWTTYTNGLPWYRSLILGYLMSISLRLMMEILLPIMLPDFIGFGSIFIFGIVWCFFNIAPFDLFYTVCKNSALKYVIQICDSFVIGESIVITCETTVNAISDIPAQTIVASCIPLCSPIVIDYLDRYFIGKRFKPMAYQMKYIGRIIFFVLLLVFVTHFGFLSYSQTRIVFPLIFILILILDIIVKREPFKIISFQKIFSHLITYYPIQ